MASLIDDTHNAIELLTKHGFTREQAQGLTEFLKEIDLSALATKADLKDALHELKIDLYKFLFTALTAHLVLVVALVELLKK